MISIEVPGRGALEFEHLVLDLNGTLAVDGVIPDGVSARIHELAASLRVHVLTADTFGTAAGYAQKGLQVQVLEPGDQVEAKTRFVRRLGAARTVAVGNGMNDEAMVREAALGILVVGQARSMARGQLLAQELAAQASAIPPAPYPVSELVLGLKCGAYDTRQGPFATPVARYASDLLLTAGGTSVLGEVTEFIGAEHILARHARTPPSSRASPGPGQSHGSPRQGHGR